MNITDVRIRKINDESKMKAVVSITFDDEFVVHDIKIIEGDDRLFLAMPSRRTPDGKYHDIVHPVGPALRDALETRVLDEYRRAVPTAQM